jgi:hypothetical protein
MNADDAEKRCADLQHAGADDWGLAPHLRLQLLTIDYSRSSPAADPKLFPDAESRWYWTGHGCEFAGKDSNGKPRALWQVDGSVGSVFCGYRSDHGFVRPCRVVARPGQ